MTVSMTFGKTSKDNLSNQSLLKRELIKTEMKFIKDTYFAFQTNELKDHEQNIQLGHSGMRKNSP